MIKVVMNLKEIVALVDKVSVSLLDGIFVKILPQETKTFISLSACDRACQTVVMGQCETDVNLLKKDGVTSFVADRSFVDAVKAVSVTEAEKVEITFSSKKIIVCAGNAQLEAKVRADATELTQCNPAEALARFKVDSNDLITTVRKGGYTFSLTGCKNVAFNNSIAFVPWMEEENAEIRVLSTNASGSNIAVRKMFLADGVECIKNAFEEKKGWMVNASYLVKILPYLKGDSEIFVWEKQIMIRCGNSYFTSVLGGASGFNPIMAEALYKQSMEASYSMIVKQADLKAAIQVASVGVSSIQQEGKVIEIFLDGDVLTVTSYGGSSKMTVNCRETSGAIHKAISIDLLKKALSQLTGDDVKISGSNGGIFVWDNDKNARIIIAPYCTREQMEEKNKEI